MDRTLEQEDGSAARITGPLAVEPDQPSVPDELSLPAELPSAEELTQPTTKPIRPTIRRSVERRVGSWRRPRPQSQSQPRPRPRPRRRWWRIAWRVVKTLLLTAELGAILVLASYAGLIKVLPALPPRLSVAATGHTVVARAGSYCWFTPGRATCYDASNAVVPPQKLPHVTLARGDSLSLTFAYPAPTRCAATAAASTDSTASLSSLGTLGRATGSSSLASSRLPVTLAPGTYVVSITCNWAPRSTMRWLQGQGSSAYLLAVVITRRR
jgi:hypothetical protein